MINDLIAKLGDNVNAFYKKVKGFSNGINYHKELLNFDVKISINEKMDLLELYEEFEKVRLIHESLILFKELYEDLISTDFFRDMSITFNELIKYLYNDFVTNYNIFMKLNYKELFEEQISLENKNLFEFIKDKNVTNVIIKFIINKFINEKKYSSEIIKLTDNKKDLILKTKPRQTFKHQLQLQNNLITFNLIPQESKITLENLKNKYVDDDSINLVLIDNYTKNIYFYEYLIDPLINNEYIVKHNLIIEEEPGLNDTVIKKYQIVRKLNNVKNHEITKSLKITYKDINKPFVIYETINGNLYRKLVFGDKKEINKDSIFGLIHGTNKRPIAYNKIFFKSLVLFDETFLTNLDNEIEKENNSLALYDYLKNCISNKLTDYFEESIKNINRLNYLDYFINNKVINKIFISCLHSKSDDKEILISNMHYTYNLVTVFKKNMKKKLYANLSYVINSFDETENNRYVKLRTTFKNNCIDALDAMDKSHIFGKKIVSAKEVYMEKMKLSKI